MKEEEKKDGAIESPFVEPKEFDYNKLRQETTQPALIEILQLFGKEAEKLAYDENNMGQVEDDYTDVQKSVQEILIKHNVNRADMTYLFGKLNNIPVIIQNAIAKELNLHEREIMSRVVGARNPGSAKFDIDSSTISDVFRAVIKSREETGNNVFDYHFQTPSKASEVNKEETNGQEN